jgi:tRNA nucleotidyltransferase (CCA-adding enzyme)
MQIYLVGGAVRDKLLNREVSEKDWLITGATSQQLLAEGYQQVGADFPVFLHPQTKEEYALARKERKSGTGHTEFEFEFDPSVTLEEDLIRRDLTVNAMAMDENGRLFDPYGGQQDLKNRVLRHVSDAFIEDPLRVFRVARFAARYAHLGFSVAQHTQTLMQQIAQSGELASLSPERVWKETSRALLEPAPQVYFELLKNCDALEDWFPELAALWGVPNPPKWHPEIDTGIHTMMVLEQSALLSDQLAVRYAALVHDLGKGITPKSVLPSHRGHETLGLPLVEQFSQRLKVSKEALHLAKLTCRYHGNVHNAFELKASTIVSLLDKCDAWRKPQRLQQMLLACEADSRGRTGFEQLAYPQASYLWHCFEQANTITVTPLLEQNLTGKAIGEALHQMRVQAVKSWRNQYGKSEDYPDSFKTTLATLPPS